MQFRQDINGLRAAAVLSVLFYHFGLFGFGGGFVGVDVFFVISGFLMTQIIVTQQDEGRFNLISFYMARARRIVPALAAVTAAVLAAGFFFLTPADYATLGGHGFSALGFFSNVVFSHRGDYFDTSAQESWLLHTWSLSVEWQFYLLFPLLLMAAQKWGQGRFLEKGFIAVFAVSLLMSLFGTAFRPTEAFFLLPARGWEFLAGGFVFFAGRRFSHIPYLDWAGLACILVAAVFYSSGLDYPGGWALLPVLGTALVLAAQADNILLANKPAQFFGAISYSLYLLHWPVLALAKYFDVPFTFANSFALTGLSVALAALSYKFVETPFRSKKGAGVARRAACFGAYALIVLLGGAVQMTDGLPSRVSEEVRRAEQALQNPSPRRVKCPFDYKKNTGLPECIIGVETPPSAVIWGDSHVGALLHAADVALTGAGRSALFYTYSGCPPILGSIFATKWKKNSCRDINRATYEKILADPRIRDVFLIARWSVYLHGYNEKGAPHPYVVFDERDSASEKNLDGRARQYADKMVETMCALSSGGVRVHALLPVPEMGRNVPTALAKSRLLHHRDDPVEISRRAYEERNDVVLKALDRARRECGVRLMDSRPYLCDKASCAGIRDGVPLYSDDDHLSELGNTLVKPVFVKEMQKN